MNPTLGMVRWMVGLCARAAAAAPTATSARATRRTDIAEAPELPHPHFYPLDTDDPITESSFNMPNHESYGVPSEAEGTSPAMSENAEECY